MQDENYHVRRLVSEGTRPRLPWAKSVTLTQEQTISFLDALHADIARFVTRSVANHMNDISKINADIVVSLLSDWKKQGLQSVKELDWMTHHSLRTLVKKGYLGALELLGYSKDVPVSVDARILTPIVMMGDAVSFEITISAQTQCPVLVDYRIEFARANGRRSEKVFKLKQGKVGPSLPLNLKKVHKLKADATTVTLFEGAHHITIQVNGVDHTVLDFQLTST